MYRQMCFKPVCYYTNTQVKLMNKFRELWEQHAMWTRAFIVSNVANLGDLDEVAARLLRNTEDFANVFNIFYGNKVANKFHELFREHILLAGKLIESTKSGNSNAIEQDRRAWYMNGDAIVEFLASINPYWDVEKWRAMFFEHLKMIENMLTLRLNGCYAAEIAEYDNFEVEALKMADLMSQGIIKQFCI